MPKITSDEKLEQEKLLNQIFEMVQESKKKPKKKINMSEEERQIRLNRLAKGRLKALENRLRRKEEKAKAQEGEKQGEKQGENVEETKDETPKIEDDPKVEEDPKIEDDPKIEEKPKEEVKTPKIVNFEPMPRKKRKIRFNIDNPF